MNIKEALKYLRSLEDLTLTKKGCGWILRKGTVQSVDPIRAEILIQMAIEHKKDFQDNLN